MERSFRRWGLLYLNMESVFFFLYGFLLFCNLPRTLRCSSWACLHKKVQHNFFISSFEPISSTKLEILATWKIYYSLLDSRLPLQLRRTTNVDISVRWQCLCFNITLETIDCCTKIYFKKKENPIATMTEQKQTRSSLTHVIKPTKMETQNFHVIQLNRGLRFIWKFTLRATSN